MSVIGAMFSGISGLNSNAQAMEIIGNNLANINTPAFKYSRADFADVLSKLMSQGFSVGRGSSVIDTTMVFAQGGFQTTDNVTDLALSGKGFFMVYDAINQGSYYTRAGNFSINREGYMVSSQGFRLQGYQVDDTGEPAGLPGDILIPQVPLDPQASSEVKIHTNLDSTASYVGPFDVTDPVNTSNFATAITVYDSLGNPHQITTYFTIQNAPGPGGGNIWDYNVVVDGDDATGGVAYVAAGGTLEFNTDGELQAQAITTPSNFDFIGATTQDQAIDFVFGTPIADGGTGVDGSTQFGDQSAVLFQGQDGFSPAYLESLDIDPDGIVFGRFSNGETRNFARVSIVNFSNIAGLNQLGANLFSTSTESGDPVVSVANVSGNGSVFSNTLELSNVDVASQFVTMITTQRGFQANSRSITTSDEMMAELINMTR